MRLKKAKYQRGMSLLSVSMALIVVIIVGTMLAYLAQLNKYERIAYVSLKRIETVHDAMQRAYMDAVTTGTPPNAINAYPVDAASLVAGGYINSCSTVNESAGLCINNLKLPWVALNNTDQMITISTALDPVDNFPTFELKFSVSGLNPIKLRNIVRSKISELPNYTDDGSGNISVRFNRPGSTVMLQNMVRRDGTTPMTSDWDFGNHHLDNVKDISFNGMNDRTAITGSVKLGSAFIANSAGIRVDQPSCPNGYFPKIEVWSIAMGGTDVNQLPYNTRSFAAWYVKHSNTHWQLYYRTLGENSAGTATFFYQGAVAYATWCDF